MTVMCVCVCMCVHACVCVLGESVNLVGGKKGMNFTVVKVILGETFVIDFSSEELHIEPWKAYFSVRLT